MWKKLKQLFKRYPVLIYDTAELGKIVFRYVGETHDATFGSLSMKIVHDKIGHSMPVADYKMWTEWRMDIYNIFHPHMPIITINNTVSNRLVTAIYKNTELTNKSVFNDHFHYEAIQGIHTLSDPKENYIYFDSLTEYFYVYKNNILMRIVHPIEEELSKGIIKTDSDVLC